MTRQHSCLAVAISTFFWIGCVTTPNQPRRTVEADIRRLEDAEAQGLLHKDSTALRKIWASDFIVNNPRDGITHGSDGVIALIRSGIIDYASFVREIEAISFHGSTVIVMGSERLSPVGKSPFAGQQVRRRFTHFWMKRNGEWRLTARHANVVSQGNP